MFTCKIAGVRWYDAGSDVNWIEYGGKWARPAGPDAPGLWYALRFDPEETGARGTGPQAGTDTTG